MSAAAVQHAVPKGIQGRSIIATLPKKLAKRAILSQQQYERRLARKRLTANKSNEWERRAEVTRQYAMTRANIRNERAWRREDWVKGALAPKRDIGERAHTFAALDAIQVYSPDKLKGRWKEYGIEVGDRVCVVNGRHKEKGKIGVVREVRRAAEEVVVTGLNVVDVAIPDYMLAREQDKTKVRPYEKPFSLKDVRLVAPLADPETGKLKDHIINELTLRKVTAREQKGLDPPTRYVSYLEPPQYIPYPEKKEDTAEEHEIDTLRIEVDQSTWVPTLHMPPMPPSVLDELRNKFSKFRFRHDDEYLADMEKEERKKMLKQRSARLMESPVKTRRRLERLERKALGVPELDEESLARIGELMERKLMETASDAQSVPKPTSSA